MIVYVQQCILHTEHLECIIVLITFVTYSIHGGLTYHVLSIQGDNNVSFSLIPIMPVCKRTQYDCLLKYGFVQILKLIIITSIKSSYYTLPLYIMNSCFYLACIYMAMTTILYTYFTIGWSLCSREVLLDRISGTAMPLAIFLSK